MDNLQKYEILSNTLCASILIFGVSLEAAMALPADNNVKYAGAMRVSSFICMYIAVAVHVNERYEMVWTIITIAFLCFSSLYGDHSGSMRSKAVDAFHCAWCGFVVLFFTYRLKIPSASRTFCGLLISYCGLRGMKVPPFQSHIDMCISSRTSNPSVKTGNDVLPVQSCQL